MNRQGHTVIHGRRKVVKQNNRKTVNYVIVTNTQGTEKNYFDGLRENLPEKAKRYVVVTTYETHLKTMIHKCRTEVYKDHQFRQEWLVFDRDEVKDFDEIIEKAEGYHLHCAWSNPCFEIWLYAYYGKMPEFLNSQQCWKSFGKEFQKRTGIPYEKNDRWLYRHLMETGDEEKAIQLAIQKLNQCYREGREIPSEMHPCTKVYELVKDIKENAIRYMS